MSVCRGVIRSFACRRDKSNTCWWKRHNLSSCCSRHDCHAFLALAEAGSFVEAAERLHLGPTAVSKHIAALEREVGVSLVRRRPAFALTQPGRFLADYVERAGALLEQAEYAVCAPWSRRKPAVLASVRRARRGPTSYPASCVSSSASGPWWRVDFRLGEPDARQAWRRRFSEAEVDLDEGPLADELTHDARYA